MLGYKDGNFKLLYSKCNMTEWLKRDDQLWLTLILIKDDYKKNMRWLGGVSIMIFPIVKLLWEIKKKYLSQLLTVESLILIEVTWKSKILLTERDKFNILELPVVGL